MDNIAFVARQVIRRDDPPDDVRFVRVGDQVDETDASIDTSVSSEYCVFEFTRVWDGGSGEYRYTFEPISGDLEPDYPSGEFSEGGWYVTFPVSRDRFEGDEYTVETGIVDGALNESEGTLGNLKIDAENGDGYIQATCAYVVGGSASLSPTFIVRISGGVGPTPTNFWTGFINAQEVL